MWALWESALCAGFQVSVDALCAFAGARRPRAGALRVVLAPATAGGVSAGGRSARTPPFQMCTMSSVAVMARVRPAFTSSSSSRWMPTPWAVPGSARPSRRGLARALHDRQRRNDERPGLLHARGEVLRRWRVCEQVYQAARASRNRLVRRRLRADVHHCELAGFLRGRDGRLSTLRRGRLRPGGDVKVRRHLRDCTVRARTT